MLKSEKKQYIESPLYDCDYDT